MNRFMLRRLTWLKTRITQLEKAGKLERAAVLREQHCRELAQHLGAGHPAHLEALLRLTECHHSLDRDDDAERVYRSAIDHFETTIEDSRDLDTEAASLGAQLLNDLGVFLCRLQRPDEALEPLRRASELSTRYLPRSHSALARVHNNLASALHSMGRFQDARQHYERALALLPELPPSSDRVHCLADLTECLVDLDDPDSPTALQDTLDQARGTLVHDAMELAQMLIRLAGLAERLQRRVVAIDLLEEAVGIVEHEPKGANLLTQCLSLLSILQEPRLGELPSAKPE